MLKEQDAKDAARRLHGRWQTERDALDLIRRYYVGRQRLPAIIPTGAPKEARVMARSSRVNVCRIVVNSLVQSMYVSGYRGGDNDEKDLDVWKVWQANKMDARQTGLHRATAMYGRGYNIVLPGKPVPVIRPTSPRDICCEYGEDPDWPQLALARLGVTKDGAELWRLYDEIGTYYLERRRKNGQPGDGEWTFIQSDEHGFELGAPVVRYVDEDDLDADDEVDAEQLGADLNEPWPLTSGQVGPIAPLQDQIDLTTFDLQIAQHYAAFKQRYIIGWAAESEEKALKVSAARLVTIDNADDDSFDPASVKVGEWAESDLNGYLSSRNMSLNHVASLAQLPLHELAGDARRVNLSAEALAGAEASKDRKVGERRKLNGERHEQTLWACGKFMNKPVPDDAEVRWEETSARSFAATVDGLGKLAVQLGVPPQELWERIPGTTKQDVERWKDAAKSGDPFSNLERNLDRQADDEPEPVPA